jgi:hypothetical protein
LGKIVSFLTLIVLILLKKRYLCTSAILIMIAVKRTVVDLTARVDQSFHTLRFSPESKWLETAKNCATV